MLDVHVREAKIVINKGKFNKTHEISPHVTNSVFNRELGVTIVKLSTIYITTLFVKSLI